ncbi:MAG: DUF2865 domain-containing protein [Pseudolabrys sp.]
MAARGESMILRVSAGVMAAGALTFASLTPASAGIFERIFGGFLHTERHTLPTNLNAFADPFGSVTRETRRSASGPAGAYCVRTSDGFYFPVQARAGVSAAEACHTFCPGSPTRLYSGGAIDNAVASDGSRYADLDTAFLYRKELVVGATCNGRDRFGLAHVDVNTDPTLRPGDIVASKTGLVAFTGMKNKVAEFVPINDYRGVPRSTREKLAGVKIMPPAPSASKLVSLVGQSGSSRDENRSAQLSR